jgi:hypothetical protein
MIKQHFREWVDARNAGTRRPNKHLGKFVSAEQTVGFHYRCWERTQSSQLPEDRPDGIFSWEKIGYLADALAITLR